MRRIAILASLLTIGLAGCATDYREGGRYYDEPGYVEPGPVVYYGSGPRYRDDYRPGYRPGRDRPWYGRPGGGSKPGWGGNGPKPGWGGNGPKPGWGGNGPKPGGGDGDRPHRRDYNGGSSNSQQGSSGGEHCGGYRSRC